MHIAVVALNIGYAAIGALGAIGAMYLGYRCLDHLTPFNCSMQLERGNSAVGIMVAGMFVGVGVATGLAIGLGLN